MKLFLVLLCVGTLWAAPPSNPAPNYRIVNGQQADHGQFPFAVGIYLAFPGLNGTSFCGGTLITHSWVLTAAHCLLYNGIETSQVILVFGPEHVFDIPNSVYRVASAYFIHPEYVPNPLTNDLAFLNYSNPVQFTDTIRPIDFLSTKHYDPHIITTAIGWGAKSDSEALDLDYLHYTELETMSNAECMRLYGNIVQGQTLCAIGTTNEGICYGDIGGPLLDVTDAGEYILVGIAYFHSEICEAQHPSGFVRVSEFYEMIKEVTGFVQIDDDNGQEDDSDDNGDEDIGEDEDDNKGNNDDDDGNNDNNGDDNNSAATDPPPSSGELHLHNYLVLAISWIFLLMRLL